MNNLDKPLGGAPQRRPEPDPYFVPSSSSAPARPGSMAAPSAQREGGHPYSIPPQPGMHGQGFAPPPGYAPPGGYGPPPGYAPPPAYGYGPQPYYLQPAAAPTNGNAIASLVLGIVWLGGLGSLLAVIFGHVARSQNKRTGQGGMATAGLILGYLGLALLSLFIVAGVLGAQKQSSRAQSASARSDAVTVGKNIAAYYVDGTSPLVVSASGGTWTVADDAGSVFASGRLSPGNTIDSSSAVRSYSNWCVAVDASGGQIWHYSAADGLVAGVCP